ncbi:MAG: Gfo/Idh/MocA family oxidoreductase [Clostridiales bacterium]|nr:Gfo/Idh/MocA family oxidoreductase [Clostridiales bacterium]
MSYKVGFMGFGGMISGYHLGTIRREDVPFEAVAAFDIDPERRADAEAKGLIAYDDPDRFLSEGKYDLVVVGTSNNYHCELACRAMEAGFNVMTEKPAARNSAEVARMIETSERTGKLFTVHQNRRWDPDFLKIRQAIADGCIGKPYMIESRIHSANGAGDMYGWRGMKDHGGGMLLDWGVHMLDQILYMIEEPIRTVYANVFPLWSEEVDDYAKVVITFESGLCAQMEVATYAPIPLPRWMVWGDRGALTMQDIGSPAAHVRRIKQDTTAYEKVKAFEDYEVHFREQSRHRIQEFEEFDTDRSPGGGWHSLYQNLAGVLAGTEELNVKPAQVLRCMKVIEAAFRSSEEGIAVRF